MRHLLRASTPGSAAGSAPGVNSPVAAENPASQSVEREGASGPQVAPRGGDGMVHVGVAAGQRLEPLWTASGPRGQQANWLT